jgi:hypothetical protein
VPESPHIDFRVHESRNGRAGAQEEFERMIGQLVAALYGDAHVVWPNPGDGGIDVLQGELNGRIAMWQCKYFPENVGPPQYRQIKDSLESAVRHARADGYTIGCWYLCVPCDLSRPAHLRWAKLVEEYQEQGIELKLWDKTRLEEKLWRDQARHLRYQFYGGEPPSPTAPAFLAEQAEVLPPRGPLDPWEAGDELHVHQGRYLLQGVPGADRGAMPGAQRRSCLAIPVGTSDLVWIQQAGGRGTEHHRESLRRQYAAGNHRSAKRNSTLPVPVTILDQDETVTLITRCPPGHGWATAYRNGSLTRASIPQFLKTVAAAGRLIQRHHDAGFDHRRLSGDVLIVDARTVRFRDGGLMAVPGAPQDSDSPYAAPEQGYPPYSAGPQTDLYQFAALIRHTLTGRLPRSAPRQPPLHLLHPTLPGRLSDVLSRALRPEPAERGSLAHLVEICSSAATSAGTFQ